jgi:hypothetical protein
MLAAAPPWGKKVMKIESVIDASVMQALLELATTNTLLTDRQREPNMEV